MRQVASGHKRATCLNSRFDPFHTFVRDLTLARPEQILFAAELPKTCSGKIMRQLLRDIAEGRVLGDTVTLADPTVVQTLKQRYEEEAG